MSKKLNYEKIASEILAAVGGEQNVISVASCATRLRVVLKNDTLVDSSLVEEIDGVKGSFNNGGQFQIVLGTGTVDLVAREFAKITQLDEVSKEEIKQTASSKMNVVQNVLKTLADVFVPILPALVAAGLLMGINNVLTAQGLFIEGISIVGAYPQITDLAEMINLFSNAAFVFLPVLIGFAAAKVFGATPVLGAVIGAIMIHPDLLNGYSYGEALLNGTVPEWSIFGFGIAKVGYQGTVLPVIASAYLLAVIEKNVRKVVPAMFDNIITPLVAVLVTAVLTFIVIGPAMRIVGDVLTEAVMFLFYSLGPVGGAIYGMVYPLLVITGMHHSLVAAETQILANMAVLGGSPTFVVVAASNVAQGAAAFAVMFLMRSNAKMKGIASASGISALLGITEPAMFGVNLKLKYPFIAALIGSAVAGAYGTLMNVLSVSPGPAGIPGVVVIRPEGMMQYLVTLLVAFVVTFIVTILLAKKFGKEK
ncbi:MAG: PTS transporter subunit EIIC [Culicoidibacterales bacterium]